MGRVFMVEVEGRAYRCGLCESPLALADHVLSRAYKHPSLIGSNKRLGDHGNRLSSGSHPDGAFSCRKGRAYLFENAVNVSTGPEEERLMMSGVHTVADIFCCGCGKLVGWKYLTARDKSQKYKEGKVVLERWTINEDANEEFHLDTNQNSSDPEYP